jgi:hypothetical protein
MAKANRYHMMQSYIDVSDCKIDHIEPQNTHCFKGIDDNTGL